jgi:putative polyketide hydroxylase
MTRRWEALGLRHSLRSQARVDRRRAHRRERVVGMVRTAAGLCPRGGGQATSSDPLHRPQSARVHNIGAQVARRYRAGRVFLAGDSARIINPPTGGLGGNTGVQEAHNLAWKLWQRCSTARLVPRATPYLSHNERHPIGLLSLYAAEAFARLGSPMGHGAEVPHSSTTGR